MGCFSRLDSQVEKYETLMNHRLGGGFIFFIFSPLLGEMIPFD